MATDAADADADSPGEVLRRWEEFGGRWHVVARTASQVTISLRRCDGGEEVQRLTFVDPELIEFVGSRTSSDD